MAHLFLVRLAGGSPQCPGRDPGRSGSVPAPLEGKLVRLRAREPEDEPYYHRWINDPEVSRYLAARYPFSHAQEREFIATPPGYSHFVAAVVTLAEGRLIGDVELRHVQPENRSAELGIMIGEREYRGRGYGTDTMRTLCRFAFEQMNLHRIELFVFADHQQAISVYERVGFRVEGRRRDAIYKHGRYHDMLVMGLLEGELRLDE